MNRRFTLTFFLLEPDSAYIYVGGLPTALTEGDVITIFSQYGEILDISLPRHRAPQPGKEQQQQQQQNSNGGNPTPKPGTRRGFGFLLYEDQRSTILAVDNLNDSTILDRKIRVEHVKDFKQVEKDKDNKGKFKEREEMRFNARPELIGEAGPSNSNQISKSHSKASDQLEEDLDLDLDLEDPMASYLSKQRKGKSSSSSKDQEKEEKKRRKQERARIREERKLKKEGKRRRASHDSSDDEDDGGVNRFEEMKKRRLEEEKRNGGDRDSRDRDYSREKVSAHDRDQRDDYRRYADDERSRNRSYESRDSRDRHRERERERSPRRERR